MLMRKLGKNSEEPMKKPDSFWKVAGRRSLALLSIALALFALCFVLGSCGRKPMATLMEERVFHPKELDCWTDGKTFTCRMPDGGRIDNFLVVGKLRYHVDQQLLQECLEEGLRGVTPSR